MTDKVKSFIVFFVIILSVFSCKKDEETVLIIKENYGLPNWSKEKLIKGNLYAGGFEERPMYSNLFTDNNGEIHIPNLLTGTYRFEFYTKPDGITYNTVARDTIFQVKEGETRVIKIE
ncbi:MAG: hypothetical protein AB7S48_16505 [Bacteroidales bacterium]